MAKSRKLFWDDPYAAETETKITSVNGGVVTLDRTVAFAWPGGQLPDTGTVGGWPILGAKYDAGDIYYTLDPNHRLKPGDTVTMGIDWDQRYIYMKLHFAAELAIVVLRGKFGYDPETLTRADILSSKAVLEYRTEGDPPVPGGLASVLPALAEEVRGLVAADHAIISGWLDEEAEKRYWEIPGLAKVPCNGTHLRRTGEIGPLRITHTSPAPEIEGLDIFPA